MLYCGNDGWVVRWYTCYVMCYMVGSSFHVSGCDFYLWWLYNLCYTRVNVDTDTVREA